MRKSFGMSCAKIRRDFLGKQNIKTSLIICNKYLFKIKKMKKNIEYTPSTAHKRITSSHQGSINYESNYKSDFSPTVFSPSNRRNNARLSSKIQGLKSTFDDLVSAISDKKSIQKNASQKIWEANTQLSEYLSNSTDYSRDPSLHSQREAIKIDSYKASGFGEDSIYVGSQKSNSIVESSTPPYQNIRLKQSLNTQIRSTNGLMSTLKSLQRQHEYVRQQSTHDRPSRQQLEQNMRLKGELQRLNEQKGSGYSMKDLWRQFILLKQENQRLREETIGMLKSKQLNQAQRPTYQSFAY